MRDQLPLKKRNKNALPKAFISSGLVLAAILVSTPVFANGFSAHQASQLGPIAASIFLGSAILFEIWRRISSQRRLESFVRNIRDQ